jgi:sarcosine oxidase gamma subunit
MGVAARVVLGLLGARPLAGLGPQQWFFRTTAFKTPAMTAMHSILPTLMVAIDISKHRHEVPTRIPGKTRRRRLTVMNALEDFQRPSAVLTSYGLGIRYAAG